MIELLVDTVLDTITRWDRTPLPADFGRKARTTSKARVRFERARVPIVLDGGSAGGLTLRTRQGSILLASSSGWTPVVENDRTAYEATLSTLTQPVLDNLGTSPSLAAKLEVYWTEPDVDERSATADFLIRPPVTTGDESTPTPVTPPYPSASAVQAAIDALGTKQPLDSDLTAIAALATTAYGRAFLTLANQAALLALLPPYLKADGSVALSANMALGGFKLTNLGVATAGGDAANLTKVNTQVGTLASDPANWVGIFEPTAWLAALDLSGIFSIGADIPSAATTNLGAATGDFVTVTGTTTITALGTANAGMVRMVRFAAVLTLTHHSTALILPTGQNIVTATDDVAVFRSLGGGNWICTSYSGEPFVKRMAAQPLNIDGFSKSAWKGALDITPGRVAADVSYSTTTLANVAGLTSPTLAISTTYSFRAVIFYDADAAGGHKYAVTVPGTSPSILAHARSVEDATGDMVIAGRLTSSGAGIGESGSVAGCTEIVGTITTGSTSSGVLRIQFAQNAAGGTSKVLAGSYLQVW